MTALINGVLTGDPNHLMSFEPNVQGQNSGFGPVSTYSDVYGQGSFGAISGMNINGAYTYAATYGQTIVSYNPSSTSFGGIAGTNREATAPVILLEAEYEGGTFFVTGTLLNCRREAYWAMCGRAKGYIYGNATIWRFSSSWWPFSSGWQTALLSPGVGDVQRWYNFFSAIPWQDLVPDQMHQIGIAGCGTPSVTGSIDTDSYIAVAANSGVTCLVAYFSQGTSQTLTVDLSKFGSAITAKWFDPTDGSYSTIDTFSNSGTRNFAPTRNNFAGDPDWVLLLTA